MGSICACRPAGLAFYRSAGRPVSLPRCGSKEARAQSTRIRSAHPGFTTERKASAMTTTIGIDPHKGSHTAVAIDRNENVLDEIRVRSCSTQTVRLREWADRFEDRTWAVESAHGLGYLLAQQLIAAGENVIDVPPVRASRVRVLGSGRSQKNDPNDARSIAIAALRADDLAAVCVDDHSRVLKLLSKRHRDLGRLKNKACCRLHALLLEMVPGGAGFRIASVTRVNATIDSFEPVDAMGRQRQEIAYEIAADIGRYNDLWGRADHRCGDHRPVRQHRAVQVEASLRELQRDRPGRSLIGPQGSSPAQPARQPAAELGHPRHRDHTAPPRHCGPRLLRPQSRRGQDFQRSGTRFEATAFRRRLPTPRRRRPPTELKIRWAREDTQERL